MKLLNFFLFICFWTGIFSSALAQKQANHWFFNQTAFGPFGYMDFNQSPPYKTIIAKNFTDQINRYTSIADPSGQLMFYTNGKSFWNRQHQIMEHGEDTSVGSGEQMYSSITIPKPGCYNQFYSFFTKPIYSIEGDEFDGWTIYYSLVDVNAANGRGEVILKNQVLTHKKTDVLAVFEGSDGESFWLITTTYGQKNEIHAYKITAQGITLCPVTSELLGFRGYGGYYIKASPDSKYLAVISLREKSDVLEVYDFDNTSGLFSLKFQYEMPERNRLYHAFEFSPDSKNLFVIEHEFLSSPFDPNSRLVRFSTQSSTNQSFTNSKTEIFSFPSHVHNVVSHMQLSPEGKIYFQRIYDKYISVIHSPNSDVDVNFIEKDIIFDEWPGFLPLFPAFFFRTEGYKTPEQICNSIVEVCAGLPITLNPEYYNSSYAYEWKNSKTGEIFTGTNPVLSVPQNLQQPDHTYYHLKITDNNGCKISDVIEVITNPSADADIIGSKSVCPGIKEVAYWIEEAEAIDSFEWSVDGGEIVYGQGTDSILVDWGVSNLQAMVALKTVSIHGCKGSSEFPVKVFKQLDTEKPKGKDVLSCQDEIYSYGILPTNGSYYNWNIINGEILEGQGKAKISVKWHEEMEKGYLWIEESVNTDLEICFGRSDTLMVLNPKAEGNLIVNLEFVTGVLDQPETIRISYNIIYPELFEETLTVFRAESAENNGWNEIAITSLIEKEIDLPEPLVGQVIYQYKIQGSTICGAVVETSVHNNIVLSGNIIDELQEIHLDWNRYYDWNEGVKKYDLYRKLDNQENYGFLLSYNDLPKSNLNNLTDGFDHCFYIKAISNENEDYYSLSNQICLSYEHLLFIPNVFTPNNDGVNDHFEIKNIELYPEIELSIYNRYGNLIYRKNKYNNEWNAQDLPGGVYFYNLTTSRNSKHLKGWVHVLR